MNNEEFPLQRTPKARFESSAACVYCRGAMRHSMRQRCPAAPPPAPPTAPAPPQALQPQPVAYGAAPSYGAAPGYRAPYAYGHPGYVVAARGAVQASPWGFWRFVGGASGAVVLMCSLGVYIWVLFDDMTSAYQDPNIALAEVLGGLLGVLGGMALLWYSGRPFAKIVYALTALVLIIVGFFMLVFAPVYRQINDVGIAEYRASNVMYLFGALTFVWGLALAAACVRWAVQPGARARLNRWRRPLGAAYGILLSLLGLTFLVSVVFVIAASNDNEFTEEDFSAVEAVIAITAFGAQFLVPGLLLMFHGTRASTGKRSSEFVAPVGVLAAMAFAIVLLTGQINMELDPPLAAPMSVLHVLAAVLPGIAYIGIASRGSWWWGRAVRGVTWRQMTLAWALAIAVGAMSAGFVNSIGGVGVTVLLLVQNGAFEGLRSIDGSGAFFAESVFDVIGDADVILTNNEQWVANVIAIAMIPPLGEEFLKGLSVRLMMRRSTTRAQAFAMGAAAGAGFGFVEALLYGAGVVSEDLTAWWEIMLIRAGSTSLHCLATGLVGVAWWYWSIADRKREALGLFFTAVFLHALWNGFAVTLESEILWIGTLEDRTIEYIAYGFVVMLGLAFLTAIPLVARRMRTSPHPPVETTALFRMEPWLT